MNCHLCGGEIPSSTKLQSKVKPMTANAGYITRCLKPSDDHILPKSLGGTRADKNLRKARHFCNGHRSSEPADFYRMKRMMVKNYPFLDEKFFNAIDKIDSFVNILGQIMAEVERVNYGRS